MTLIAQALIDGILIGGVYAAIGIGLSLAYGVMNVVNWSHGESLMLSMYIAYLLVKHAGFDPYATILVTVPVMALLGFCLQKFVFNRVIRKGGRVVTNILLFTAGLGVCMSAVANMVFGAESASVRTRYAGMLEVGNLMISNPKLIAFAISIMATICLFIFLQRTEMGRAIRATSQDRATAQLMGINSELVFCISFAISLSLVGIAGALLVPFYPVYPYVGAVFSFKSFIIVAIGGRGNIPGALVGGLVIGVIEKIGGIFVGDNLAQVFVFILFIFILLFKPDGSLIRAKR